MKTNYLLAASILPGLAAVAPAHVSIIGGISCQEPQGKEMASALDQSYALAYQELEHRIAVLEYERRARRDELAEIDRAIYEMARRMARVELPPITA